MDKNTVLLFTRQGLGHGPDALMQLLTDRFLGLIGDAGLMPAKILFYTDGVKLACEGSPVIDRLQSLQERGVELILCKTCLDYWGLTDQVKVGVVGGMADIVQAMQDADKVISL